MRRTGEQVKKDQLAKEKAKKDKMEAHNLMINTVAHLESSLVEEGARLLLQAHHPPPTAQKKIPRPQPRPINPSGTLATDDHAKDKQPADTSVIDPALLNDQPNPAGTEDGMVLANSEDDDDNPSESSQPLQTSGNYASVRAQVHASCHVNTSEESGGHKRKASTGASSTSDQTIAALHKKVKKHNGGL
ncbi:hypothetical protein C0991_007779 [Blastosporella zonata]|nr:hypothetical protein C0991_007779 [Blastosporella zonata]